MSKERIPGRLLAAALLLLVCAGCSPNPIPGQSPAPPGDVSPGVLPAPRQELPGVPPGGPVLQAPRSGAPNSAPIPGVVPIPGPAADPVPGVVEEPSQPRTEPIPGLPPPPPSGGGSSTTPPPNPSNVSPGAQKVNPGLTPVTTPRAASVAPIPGVNPGPPLPPSAVVAPPLQAPAVDTPLRQIQAVP